MAEEDLENPIKKAARLEPQNATSIDQSTKAISASWTNPFLDSSLASQHSMIAKIDDLRKQIKLYESSLQMAESLYSLASSSTLTLASVTEFIAINRELIISQYRDQKIARAFEDALFALRAAVERKFNNSDGHDLSALIANTFSLSIDLPDEVLQIILSHIDPNWKTLYKFANILHVSKQWNRIAEKVKQEWVERNHYPLKKVFDENTGLAIQYVIDKQFKVANFEDYYLSIDSLERLSKNAPALSYVRLDSISPERPPGYERLLWPQLTKLRLYNLECDLKFAPNLKILKIYDFEFEKVVRQNFDPFANKKKAPIFDSLETFRIKSSQSSKFNLSYLKEMPNLTDLKLVYNDIPNYPDRLEQILESLPKLKVLVLSACGDIPNSTYSMTKDDLVQTLNQFPNLKLERMDITAWWNGTESDFEDSESRENCELIYKSLEKEFPKIKFIHEYSDPISKYFY